MLGNPITFVIVKVQAIIFINVKMTNLTHIKLI